MDPLNDNVVALLQTANDPFTREIWKDGKSRDREKKSSEPFLSRASSDDLGNASDARSPEFSSHSTGLQ